MTAYDCPRITPAFLEEERRRMPPAWFKSEYLCEFTDTIDSVFSTEDIERAFSADVKPLFGPTADDANRQPAETNGIEPLFV